MKKIFSILILLQILISCQKEKVDSIVINANAYTVNNTFDTAEAFAIKEGKFVAVGSTKEIQDKYDSDNIIDAKNQTIVPGLIDAHCHFLRFGTGLQTADLNGTKSYYEILERLVAFQKEKNAAFIKGRGWDQNDW